MSNVFLFFEDFTINHFRSPESDAKLDFKFSTEVVALDNLSSVTVLEDWPPCQHFSKPAPKKETALKPKDEFLPRDCEDCKRTLTDLKEAEAKAWDSLKRYKFMMFGYWAAIWVHLNRTSRAKQPNPFRALVTAAREHDA